MESRSIINKAILLSSRAYNVKDASTTWVLCSLYSRSFDVDLQMELFLLLTKYILESSMCI